MTRLVRSRNRVTQAALFPGIPPLERTQVHKVARRQPIPKWVPYLLHGVPRSQRLGKNPSFPELDPGADSALTLACQLAVTSPRLGHAGAQALSQIHLACGSSLPGAGRGRVSILPAGSAAVGAGGRRRSVGRRLCLGLPRLRAITPSVRVSLCARVRSSPTTSHPGELLGVKCILFLKLE